MSTTITGVMVVRDELPFLKYTLPRAQEFCNQMVIVDTGSKDGTLQFIKSLLKNAHDIVLEADPRDIPMQGFSMLKNTAASWAESEWIYYLDADECLLPDDRSDVKKALRGISTPTADLSTHTFHGKMRGDTHDHDWNTVVGADTYETGRHWRFARRDAPVEWRGYIHEELWYEDKHCSSMSSASGLTHGHFNAYRTWGDEEVKLNRYAWMLCRANGDEELMKYVNGWWWSTYYPKNEEELCRRAAAYESLGIGA